MQRYSAQLDQQVTDLVRSKDALHASEKRYRNLYETSPDVVFNISTVDGTIYSLNPAFEKVTGWSAAEWIGRPFAAIVHPDDVPIATEKYQQVLRGRATTAFELRIISKSGGILIGDFVAQRKSKTETWSARLELPEILPITFGRSKLCKKARSTGDP